MPKFEITSPDGKKFEITAPDGATEQDVLSYAQSQFKSKPEPPPMGAVVANAAAKGAAALPDMFLNAPANAWNIGQGVIGYGKELLGNKDAWLNTNLVAPPDLVRKAFEKAGLIRADAEPQTAGQRIADAATQGIVGAAAGPGGLLRNAATGALGAGGGQTAYEITGSPAAAIGVGLAAPYALRGLAAGNRPSTNPVREQTLREGQAAGYVVPPSEVRPNFINNTLESIGGKAAVRQEAAQRNQSVTNALAARSLGLPPDTPMTEKVLAGVRDEASEPYRQLAGISDESNALLEQLKQKRADATAYYKHYNRSADPASLKTAKNTSAEAYLIEKQLDDIAKNAGHGELVDALAEARKTIAKSHDLERAIGLGDANVSAPTLARQLDQSGMNGKTGEQQLIGRMADAFPSVMREGSKVPAAGVSATNALTAALLGTAGYGLSDNQYGAALGVLPFLRGPVRSMLLSGAYQKRMATPPPPQEPLNDAALRSLLIANELAARQQGVQR